MMPRLMAEAMGEAHSEGICFVWGPHQYIKGPEIHIHIAYMERDRYDVMLRTRAHEEQHAAAKIPGGLELLEEKIAAYRGAPIHFDKLDDSELAAEINAVYVLDRQGFNPRKVHALTADGDKDRGKCFKRAIYIYETGDYTKRGFVKNELLIGMQKLVNRLRPSRASE